MSKAKQAAAAAAASDEEAAGAKPPAKKQGKLTADIKRIEELEGEGVRLINAANAKEVAAENYKAAYHNVKEIMVRLNLTEYAMTDANQILVAEPEGIKIRLKDKPTE